MQIFYLLMFWMLTDKTCILYDQNLKKVLKSVLYCGNITQSIKAAYCVVNFYV